MGGANYAGYLDSRGRSSAWRPRFRFVQPHECCRAGLARGCGHWRRAQCLGTALPLVAKSLWALAASAAFVGGTFMVATMAGPQLARQRCPNNPTPWLARMTVAFAIGQTAGPVMVRVLGLGAWARWGAVALTNAVATVLLGVTTVWLWHGTTKPSPA